MHWLLNRDSAIRLGRVAYDAGREEHGDRLVLALLPDDKVFPIGEVAALNGGLFRCSVCYSQDGKAFDLDLTWEELASLPQKLLPMERSRSTDSW